MKPRLKASVFREAARLVAEQEETCCCFALAGAMDTYWSYDTREPHNRFFDRILKPKLVYGYWYGQRYDGDDPEAHQRADMARTIGLLLCAELVKEGWE